MSDPVEVSAPVREQSEIQLETLHRHEIIEPSQIINRLNYINFQGGTLTSVFNHVSTNRSLTLQTKPGPCLNKELFCHWPGHDNLLKELESYRLHKIYIDNGFNTVVIEPEHVSYSENGFTALIPETNMLKIPRKTKRPAAVDIQVQVIHNGTLYRGSLVDFTPEALRVSIPAVDRHSSIFLNPEARSSLTLIKKGKISFSGECSLLRHNWGKRESCFVFRPLANSIQVHSKKEYRSIRQQMAPSPDLVFIHPLTEKEVSLPVCNISGAGFAVEEDQKTGTLIPGLLIPDARIVFSTGMQVNCRTRVLYRTEDREDSHHESYLCGLTITDMEPSDHARLMSLIFLAKNRNLHLSKNLDPEALWRFFFESGFIYPEKYAHMQTHKEEIKENYRKIYNNVPDFARHITYQERGEIQGHMSMLRTYEDTWLMHHHAASNSANLGAGLYVMDQLSDYAYNANKIESLHLDYLMCFYRPENKFPAKVFGGAAAAMKEPDGCSIDEFAFMNFDIEPDIYPNDFSGWELSESRLQDLEDLENYYNSASGGLMLKAMNLFPGSDGNNDVISSYNKSDYKREIHLYSLKKEGKLYAFFIADLADTGINMSELTNNIKTIILRPEELPPDILTSWLNEIAKKHFSKNSHILLFPVQYADTNSIAYEKIYSMWIVNLEYSDAYFKYLKKLLRFIKT